MGTGGGLKIEKRQILNRRGHGGRGGNHEAGKKREATVLMKGTEYQVEGTVRDLQRKSDMCVR
jgi:hypothetical protein